MKDRFKCNDCGTEFSKSQEAEKCCRGDYTDRLPEIIEQERQEIQETVKRNIERANLKQITEEQKAQYKHLAAGSGNIKRLLKVAFPGIVFSVRSKSYSMGNSIDIDWTDGPTVKEVERYTKMFQYSNGIDPYTDCENSYNKSDFMDRYGSAKYVQTCRTIKPETRQRLFDVFKVNKAGLENITTDNDIYMTNWREHYNHFLFNTSYPASGDFTITDRIERVPGDSYYKRYVVVDNVKTATGKATETALSDIGGYDIEKRYHTKKEIDFWVAVPQNRTDKETYYSVLEICKSLGGWYCRAWDGDKGGFAFTEEERAKKFVEQVSNGDQEEKQIKPVDNSIAINRLEKLRDSMQKTADDKLRDRPTHTARMQKQAMNARTEGEQYQEAADCVDGLITAYADIPIAFKGLTKKKALDYCNHKKALVENGFHAYYTATSEYQDNSPEAISFRSYGDKNKQEEMRRTSEQKRKRAELNNIKIPGYFRTPDKIADMLVSKAYIHDGDTILEPSCGDGSLLNAIGRATMNNTTIHVRGFEINQRLYELAREQHEVYKIDCMSVADCMLNNSHNKYSKIIMNPPFENCLDIHHVKHCFNYFLADDGRLVAIMSPHWTYAKDKLSQQFREFIADIGGEWELLPENSFKESGTGVNCGILVVNK